MKTKNKIFSLFILLSLSLLNACGQTKNNQKTANTATTMENPISKPENPYYSNTDTTKLHVTDAE